ncbi:nuclear fragile X mental retardation-interacting protein 1 [Synchiropus splendidus]|uniref:nuclear fragile X mental retardation-interacting protein 1 n=1 Tax=Synchiropus splendidus TaxID=270530 RepID=UPI00237E3C95|nr:nuclear fragile X mental retardation-interacting protein 1 [Synchiropus splendidus]
MSEPAHYPSPDFDRPPTNSFTLPSRSSFHASMWSWTESPTEPSRGSCAQPPWHQSPVATSYNYYTHGHHNAQTGHGWHQAGHRGGWQHYNPSGNHGKTNKKEPEYLFFCDTCDRGFKNNEKYGEHMAQHVQCSVPDCSFTAHEKIVSIHWKNNHAPGKKRIKLDTPEEIAKWREERRRNYPTLQNIEKKMKVMEEREVTGAVLETAQFGRMRGRGRGQRWMHGRGKRGRQYPGASHCSTAERPPQLTTPRSDGDPLGALVSNEHESDKDEAAAESRSSSVTVPPKQMSSALACLVASYGSASESDEEPGASPLLRAQEAVQENLEILSMSAPKVPCDDGSHTGSKLQSPHANRRGGRGRGGRGGMRGRGGHQATPQQRRPTLLEMLLASDIRHERNVLLQCVRFVVQNNFFRHENGAQSGEATRGCSDPPREGTRQRRDVPSDVLLPQCSPVIPEALATMVGPYLSENSLDLSERTCPSTDHAADELRWSSEETGPTAATYDDEIWESHLVT